MPTMMTVTNSETRAPYFRAPQPPNSTDARYDQEKALKASPIPVLLGLKCAFSGAAAARY